MPLLRFVFAAYLISWLCWLPLALRGPVPGGGGSAESLHLVGSLGPALAAFLVTLRTGGLQAARRLAGNCLKWRVPLLWHAAAWLGPFGGLFAAQALAHSFGLPIAFGLPDHGSDYPDLPTWLYGLAVLIFYGFGEEIGWRGFALPLLQTRYHPARATLMVAAIWAIWHTPLFLFSPGLSGLDAGGVAGWLLSLVTGAFLLTFLYNGSGGSILIVAAFHATMDLAFLGPPEVMMIVGGLTTLLGLIAAMAVFRNGPASRPPAS